MRQEIVIVGPPARCREHGCQNLAVAMIWQQEYNGEEETGTQTILYCEEHLKELIEAVDPLGRVFKAWSQ